VNILQIQCTGTLHRNVAVKSMHASNISCGRCKASSYKKKSINLELFYNMLAACRIEGCFYLLVSNATNSTDPTAQTTNGTTLYNEPCATSITLTAPWGPAVSAPNYFGISCTTFPGPVGPPQIYTDAYGLKLVPSTCCIPNWAGYLGTAANPAARVTLVLNNATNATTLRSVVINYYGLDMINIFLPLNFRFTSSSGTVVNATSIPDPDAPGYAVVDLPTPLLIQPFGNATMELLDGFSLLPRASCAVQTGIGNEQC
jgi:hypothetical protein